MLTPDERAETDALAPDESGTKVNPDVRLAVGEAELTDTFNVESVTLGDCALTLAIRTIRTTRREMIEFIFS